MQTEWDLVVVGGGSGGVRASRVAASLGAKVLLVEGGRLGGTCVNVGCVPKKLLAYGGRFARAFEDAAAFGWTVPEPSFDWARLIANKDQEIARLNAVYGRLLESSGVSLLEGWARFVEPRTIEVNGVRHRGQAVLLATGSKIVRPSVPGIEHAIDSDRVFSLPELPERILVVGAGYVACEFASLFRNLGRSVVMIHRGPAILSGFDEDVQIHLGEALRKHGIDLRLVTELASITKSREGLEVRFQSGTSEPFDIALVATGRRPDVTALGPGLSELALRPSGYVVVDDQGRTNLEGLYAVGDLIDTVGLTPVALHEGTVVANVLFGDRALRFDHEFVPTAVFSEPEVATVGMTEAEGVLKHGLVDVYESQFRPLKHTLTGFDDRTYMKLVVEPASDRVLGVHMVGADAAEILQGVAVALRAGAKKADFDRTIGIHPTAAEELVTMRQKRPAKAV